MGTPDFAVPTLTALVAAGHQVVAAYTQPPRPGGRRGKELTPTPVHRKAEKLGIAVRHPASLKGAEEQAAFAALGADIAVVAAYGLILPQAVLDAPKHGCLNIHASLLPRWRGAAPIQRAIMAGDEETGVTIMQMEKGLDTGPMLLRKKTWIGSDTAGAIEQRLSEIGAEAMIEVLSNLAAYTPVPQPDWGVTYAEKISKTEARLDFRYSAVELARKVRAFNPAPGAWFELGGERVKLLAARPINRWPGTTVQAGEVIDRIAARTDASRPTSLKPGEAIVIACGEGYLEPLMLQRAGKQSMSVRDFLRGSPIPPGSTLT